MAWLADKSACAYNWWPGVILSLGVGRGSASGGSYSWPGVSGRWAGGPGGGKSFGAHVAFPDDPFVVLLDQQGTEEAGDGVAVREDTPDIGATTDLFVKPDSGLLERIFGECSTGKALKARMSSAASRTYKAASQKPAVVSLSTTSPPSAAGRESNGW